MKFVTGLFFVLMILGIYSEGHSQIFYTKSGTISFNSETPLEKIEATNNKAVSILNLDENKIEFSVLIKGFHFPNALMQTHFNENYMLSDVYPKAVFKSTEVDLSALDIDKEGTYQVAVKGILTIKDVDKEIDTVASIEVQNKSLSGKASFVVSPSDFNIEIPKIVKDKIAKEIQITVGSNYKLYEKS